MIEREENNTPSYAELASWTKEEWAKLEKQAQKPTEQRASKGEEDKIRRGIREGLQEESFTG